MAKDPIKYWQAEDVRGIADELIPQFHEHLHGEGIMYLFRSEHAEAEGKPVWGKAKRVTGLNAYLTSHVAIEEENDGTPDNPHAKMEAPPLRVVEIAFDVWQVLNATQRIALVDHELCHFGMDGPRGHEVEEFREVIQRHGLWRPEIEDLAKTIEQRKLFPDEDVKDVPPRAMRAIKQAVKKMGQTMREGESVTISTPGEKGFTITKDGIAH